MTQEQHEVEGLEYDEKFGYVGVADERQLQLLMNDWRHGRTDRNLWQALQDAYVMVFGLVLIGAMLISAVVQAQSNAAGCSSQSCQAARGLLPWAAMAGVFAFTLLVARTFGPVVASSAEGFWLMDAPLDRRELLKQRFVRALLVAFIAGAGFGALVAALTGVPGVGVAVWALACGLGSVGLTAFAASEQVAERRWLTQLLQFLVGAVAVGALAALVAISAGKLPAEPLRVLNTNFAFIVAAVGLVITLIFTTLSYARLRRIRRQRLTAGSSLLSGMQGAAFALDFALIRDILVEYKAKLKGHVRATRGVGSGLRALVMRDVQRLWRNPGPLAVWLAAMVVPYAVQGLGIAAVNAPVSAFVLMCALIGFLNTLRVLSRTKGLSRCFPFPQSSLRTAAMVVPAGLALIWAIVAIPAFTGAVGTSPLKASDGVTYALVTAFAGFLGAIRWISAKPADYSRPMVAVGFGAMPPGMMFSFLRGIDMIAIVTLPIVFRWSPWISIVIGIIAFSVLRSGMDQEAMMDLQKEQQRLKDEAKKQREERQQIRVQRRR